MSHGLAEPAIRLRGVRQNNLKNFDLDLPLGQLVVVTGLSGSGKSSLAFDTLFAEGQRRYMETFSPYARQFLDRMDKPKVDVIEGIPPAIAIEQRNTVRSTRSTVGTMTEVCDYMRVVWPHVAVLYCRRCGQAVRRDSPQMIWGHFAKREASPTVLVTFDLPLTAKLSLDESLALVTKQGYQRLLLENRILRVEEAQPRLRERPVEVLTMVQDRLNLGPGHRARFVEACEQAYHFGKGKLTVHELGSDESGQPTLPVVHHRFSNRFHCAACDLEYREPSPALFNFNHPLGACPTCRGFGRTITIDYRLVLPDRTRTLAQGVVRPWLSGVSAECQDDLMKFCRLRRVPTDVPFEQLTPEWQTWVVEGDPGYGADAEHQWPRAWYGVKGYFCWLESKSYKMHVRVLLSRYRSYQACATCQGQRFQPEALLFKAAWPNPKAIPPGVSSCQHSNTPSAGAEAVATPFLTLADFYRLPIRYALSFVEHLEASRKPGPTEPLGLALGEVRSRLSYLNDVGLGYLALDRPTRTLSGGETERVNLTTCLGTRLVNTLFVLDEPSVGLHPHDTARLVRSLEQLRTIGNTVVVVEHETGVIRAADQVIDLGPGHGEAGGQVVFQGTYAQLLKASDSLTGLYLSGRRRIEIGARRPVALSVEPPSASRPAGDRPERHRDAAPAIRLECATCHNLKGLSVTIPLGRLVCITGVSGSGKTTLVRDVLLPALAARLQGGPAAPRPPTTEDPAETQPEPETDGETADPGAGELTGWEALGRVLLVDQSSLGKTPRSNPAVYTGAFDDIREVFAQSEAARQRGLSASAFSFNSTQGQCERCRGAGFEKIEMQFLSDVFVRCPGCDGRRYRAHILEVVVNAPRRSSAGAPGWNIADCLGATVDEAIAFLDAFGELRPAQRAATKLRLLQEIGLGYLRLGQPINTLSGGESQRLKLISHLAEATASPGHRAAQPVKRGGKRKPPAANGVTKPTLFLFDEPTTGLHFDDVRVLVQVLQRLVNAGHSLVVIEHNLDLIKCADWVIDLGPGAGDEGGRLVVQGTPEIVAACGASYTGAALRQARVLPAQRRQTSGQRQGGAPAEP